MGRCGCRLVAVLGIILAWPGGVFVGQLKEQSPNEPPALEHTPNTQLNAAPSPSAPKEKLARVLANEPPLVRLARDKFGAEVTETDAKFFAAIAANYWADLRPTTETKFDPEKPSSRIENPTLLAAAVTVIVQS